MRIKPSKSLEERIKEEIQYTQILNSKIKKITKKTNEKKKKIKNNQNIFNFTKEYNYLREQQKKIENELLIQIYDIKDELEKGEDIMHEFYSLQNFETNISKDFSQTLSVVKQTNKEDPQSSYKIFEALKSFNEELLQIKDEDLDVLLEKKEFFYDEEKENKTKKDIIDLIYENDYFNALGIYDIDYIIRKELSFEYENSFLKFDLGSKKYGYNLKINTNLKNKLKTNYFMFPFQNFKLSQDIIEKGIFNLGEIEAKDNFKRIENSFKLLNLQYKKSFDDLLEDLVQKLLNISNLPLTPSIKIKCNNFSYFIKNFDHSITLTQKLNSINIVQKTSVQNCYTYTDLIEGISLLKKNKKILITNYLNEYNDLADKTYKILNEEIASSIQDRKNKIEKFDFIQRKEEMNVIHQKNKALFEIKQQMRLEKEKFQEMLRQKGVLEKQTKENERNLKNKLKTEQYKEQKNKEEKIKQQNLQKEAETLRKKQKEEIEKKLPVIIKNQINSTEKFLQNQRQKEILKEQKENNEQRLNYIVEHYKNRPNVEVDPNRVLAITECLQNKYDLIGAGRLDKADKVNLFSNNGFTVDNLMKDFRYKVSSVLYEAGLSDKQYAKELLLSLNPNKDLNNIY